MLDGRREDETGYSRTSAFPFVSVIPGHRHFINTSANYLDYEEIPKELVTEPGLDQDAEATHHPPAYYYPPRPPQYHYPHYAPPTPTTPAPIGIY